MCNLLVYNKIKERRLSRIEPACTPPRDHYFQTTIAGEPDKELMLEMRARAPSIRLCFMLVGVMSLISMVSCGVDNLEEPRADQGVWADRGSMFIPGFSDTGPAEPPRDDLSAPAEVSCDQPGTKQLCSTSMWGVCSDGSRVCQAGGLWSACEPYLQPDALAEDCGNGADDDCDGDTDAADTDCTPCSEGQQESCPVSGAAGICAQGTRLCSASGEWGACTGSAPGPEECGNGLDDDCDGQGDEVDDDCVVSHCVGPDGIAILEGQSRIYYQVSAHHDCVAVMEPRTCSGGQLSGSYTFAECTPSPAPCGVDPNHTVQTRTMYSSDAVPYGQSCQAQQQIRVCNNGAWTAWSGSYTFASCAADPPPACIDHGAPPELGSTPYQNCHVGSYPSIMIQANTIGWSGCCGFIVRECQVEGNSPLNRMYCDVDADTWCNGTQTGINSWDCQ